MYHSISTRNTHFLNVFIKFPMSFSHLVTVCSKRSGLLAKVARLLPGFAAWNRRAWSAFIRKAVGGVIALRWKTETKKKRGVQRSSKEFKVQSQIFKKRERKRKEVKNWNVREVFRHLRSLWLLPLIRRRNRQCLFQVGDVNGGAIKCCQMLSKSSCVHSMNLIGLETEYLVHEKTMKVEISVGPTMTTSVFFQLFFEEHSGKKISCKWTLDFDPIFDSQTARGLRFQAKLLDIFEDDFGLTFLTPIRRPKVKSNFAAVWDGEILDCEFPFRLLTESFVQVRSQALKRADAIGLPQGIEEFVKIDIDRAAGNWQLISVQIQNVLFSCWNFEDFLIIQVNSRNPGVSGSAFEKESAVSPLNCV